MRNRLIAALLLTAGPVTVVLCALAGGRVYYLACLLLILYTTAAFVLRFEARRPQPRELALLAVLCALAVASRVLFLAVPHFKPMAAIVMLAGFAFGAETGFLVGAVSALASNFVFGQGPWTPWQMFAFGVAGLLAGVCRRLPLLNRRLPRAVFGFAALVAVVGPLLDCFTLFTLGAEVTAGSAAAVFAAGLPVNAIHGGAVFVTLLLFGDSLLAQLDRLRRKYGLMEATRHGA